MPDENLVTFRQISFRIQIIIMATLGGFLVEQYEIINQINHAIPNLKKMGTANYTNAKVQNRLTALEKLWERCQILNIKLRKVATETDQKGEDYFIKGEFLTAEDTYNTTADYMIDVLDCLNKEVNQSTAVRQDGGDSTILHAAAATGFSVPSLSRMEIPEFSGDRLEWENFRDMYESLIKNNASLSKVTRLQYLKMKLKSDAAALLRHIKITEANFDAAWKALTDEYENTRLIINSHLQAIIDIPAMKYETASSLRSLRDITNSSVDALRNLDCPVDTWDDLLVFLLVRKFALCTRQEWQMTLGDSYTPPTLKSLIDFISKRIRGLDDKSPSIVIINNAKPRTINAKVHSASVQEFGSSREKCPTSKPSSVSV